MKRKLRKHNAFLNVELIVLKILTPKALPIEFNFSLHVQFWPYFDYLLLYVNVE